LLIQLKCFVLDVPLAISSRFDSLHFIQRLAAAGIRSMYPRGLIPFWLFFAMKTEKDRQLVADRAASENTVSKYLGSLPDRTMTFAGNY
jgi:hypothetical protein